MSSIVPSYPSCLLFMALSWIWILFYYVMLFIWELTSIFCLIVAGNYVHNFLCFIIFSSMTLINFILKLSFHCFYYYLLLLFLVIGIIFLVLVRTRLIYNALYMYFTLSSTKNRWTPSARGYRYGTRNADGKRSVTPIYERRRNPRPCSNGGSPGKICHGVF